jgi:hypothetical protein
MEKTEAHKYAYDYAYSVEAWIKQEIYKDFFLASPKFDWSNSRTCSRGGYYADGPSINIAMRGAYKDYHGEIYKFHEYASFDTDKEIGGFYSRDPVHKLQAIIVHEMAHAVQFFAYRKNNIRCKPHGPMFKNFYRRLRNHFINPNLPNQKVLLDDYEEYVNKITKVRNKPVPILKISDEEWEYLVKRAASGK